MTRKILNIALLISSALLLNACVQSPQTSRKKKAQNPVVAPSDGPISGGVPSFSNNLNFLEFGVQSTSSTLSLATNFSSSIKLRGAEVDQHLRGLSIKSNHCLVERFTLGNLDSSDDVLLLMAAVPVSRFEAGLKIQEHFFQIVPTLKATNQSLCQKTGIINKLGLLFPTAKLAYNFKDICTACSEAQLIGEGLTTFNLDGSSVSAINSSYLKLALIPVVESTTKSGTTCQNSPQCIAKNFDCCSLGQCITNGAIKDGVVNANNQQAFNNSQTIIAENPARISEFPEFYHLCPIDVPPPETPAPVPGQDERAALKRLTELRELYECTTPIDGEMSLKTITYQNSSTHSGPFLTGVEDRNFVTNYTGTANIPNHSVVEIIHGGETLFKDEITLIPGFSIGPLDNRQGNDSLTDATPITITHQVKDKNVNDELKIKYKIDGSCSEIFSGLAQCHKIYLQGQNKGSTTDHFPASNNFNIPFYANTTSTLTVQLDGITQSQGVHWQLSAGRDYIEFLGVGLQVQDTQEVKIGFFVDTNFNNVLGGSNQCLDRISEICSCNGRTCTLSEVIGLENGLATINDYSCVYPPPDVPDVPLQKTIALSAKTVPLRYFDNNGLFHSEIKGDTPPQEGNIFAYTDGHPLKPNNVATVIGFNEIYGSFVKDAIHPKPAKEIIVKKGRTYDIFVNSGSFSTCTSCGNDYYSVVTRLFPRNFLHNGGGAQPDSFETNRLTARPHRSDDSLFGRACWIPPTMIPWSHRENSTVQTQRQRRLAAQHFYFANGYQRDWYGFDYGAVIGSFDGFVWFAIGNERRAKAKSNRLYLAVNGYFGDLTLDETFSITIQESLLTGGSGSLVNNNFENSGAECQKFHQCSTDSDCIAQLGWDYTCQSITGITTPWPEFDDNALEKGNTNATIRLSALFDANNSGANNRCVYRGKGTPCYANFNNINASNSYSGTDNNAFHACAMSSYCEKFIAGVNVPKFNNRISRYPASVNLQNLDPIVPDTELTSFGLGARILGRPFKFNGTEEVDLEIQSNLATNFVRSICIPGREASNGNLSIDDSNKTVPGPLFTGDHVLNIGMTMSGPGGAGAGDSYLSQCSILDDDNFFYFHKKDHNNQSLSNATLKKHASSQAISSNSLDIFQSATFGLGNDSLTKDFNSQITFRTLEKNRCMRGAGSVCFSNSDCAPNKTISTALSALDPDNYANILNRYEILYWQEDLICSQKNAPGIDGYALTQNRCCREAGKTLSIGSLQDGAVGSYDFDNFNIPGVGIELSNSRRYTRMSAIKKELDDSPNDYPPLSYTSDDRCAGGTANCKNISTLAKQFDTLGLLAQRSCCSGDWVRNFHSDAGTETNHKWRANIGQDIPKVGLKCYNWLKCSLGDTCPVDNNVFGGQEVAEAFTCMHVEEPTGNCLARRVTDPEAEAIMKFARSLDLLGIPQVPIQSIEHEFLQCQIGLDGNGVLNQGFANDPVTGIVLPNTVKNPGNEDAEYKDAAKTLFFSSMDENNFNGPKKIFSDDSFQCCLPTGSDVPSGTPASSCCTGVLSNDNTLCVLPDFSDVSLFFNKFVSSATSGLSSSLFNQETGFMKSASTVELLACELKVCQSGRLARGIAHSNLKIKGPNDDQVWDDFRVKRFIDGDDETNNFNGFSDLYDRGLKWNTNVYCFPPQDSDDQLPDDADTVLGIINCNAN